MPFGMTNLKGRCDAQKFEFNTLAERDIPVSVFVIVHEGRWAAS
jgi:hypothetical protein